MLGNSLIKGTEKELQPVRDSRAEFERVVKKLKHTLNTCLDADPALCVESSETERGNK